MKIKALSLWQPWASLIAVGAKKYETRSWPTKYRGPLLICASKRGQRPSFERFEILGLLKHPEFFDVLLPLIPGYGEKPKPLLDLWVRGIYDVLPFGKAVALVNLTDCIQTELFKRGHPEFIRESLFGDFSSGRYAWKLENIRAIDPFRVTGRQGLFEVEVPDSLFK